MPGAGSEAPLRLPPMCSRCLVNRAAWTRPRVDVCYDCLPGGPFTPPPCSSCGAIGDYFSQGLCGRCHPRSPEHIDSCRGCLAWGVYPRYAWLCWSCRIWRTLLPRRDLPLLRPDLPDLRIGRCRLCYEQARLLQEPGKAINLAEANKYGQQLFFANLVYQRTLAPRAEPTPTWKKRLRNYQAFQADTGFHDGWVQDPLFDADPDPAAVRARAVLQDSDLTRYCAAIVNDHAARYGWSTRQRLSVIHSLRVLQTVRPTPDSEDPGQRGRRAAPLRRHHHLDDRGPRRGRPADPRHPDQARNLLREQDQRPAATHGRTPHHLDAHPARRLPRRTPPSPPRPDHHRELHRALAPFARPGPTPDTSRSPRSPATSRHRARHDPSRGRSAASPTSGSKACSPPSRPAS